MGRLILCVAICCALLAYILNPSVPDGIEERWKYRLLAASFNFYHLVVSYSTSKKFLSTIARCLRITHFCSDVEIVHHTYRMCHYYEFAFLLPRFLTVSISSKSNQITYVLRVKGKGNTLKEAT